MSSSRGYFTLSAHQRPMVGDMKMAATSIDHLGWLKCDGRYLSVAQYYQLWLVIGYNFTLTGTPATLFQLPNPAGKVPGIAGNGIDSSSPVSTMTWSTGQTFGEYQHILTIAEMPTHNHTLTDPGHNHTGRTNEYVDTPESETVIGSVVAVNTTAIVSGSNQRQLTFSTTTNTTGITIANTGGSNAHNNLQPTLVMGSMFIFTGIGRNASGKTDPLLWPYGQGTNLF